MFKCWNWDQYYAHLHRTSMHHCKFKWNQLLLSVWNIMCVLSTVHHLFDAIFFLSFPNAKRQVDFIFSGKKKITAKMGKKGLISISILTSLTRSDKTRSNRKLCLWLLSLLCIRQLENNAIHMYNVPAYLLCGNKGCCFSSTFSILFYFFYFSDRTRKRKGRIKNAIEGVESSHLFSLILILFTRYINRWEARALYCISFVSSRC